MIKAVIFDYFGVVSTDSFWDDVSNSAQLLGEGALLKQQQAKVNDGDISWQQYCEFIANEFNKSVDEVTKAYEQQIINKELVAYCASLQKRGYKTGLLSNASSSFLQPILEVTHINKIFDAIVLSSDVGHSKPNPLIYTEMLQKLGVNANEALMIDDAQINVDGAEAVGMRSLVFLSFPQAKQQIEDQLADSNN